MRILPLAALAILGLTACGGGSDSGARGAPTRSTSVDLTGAGATFPYPIYSKWFSDYAARTGVKINYQSIGSGGGIRQLSEMTVDFGASDAPMTDEEMAKAKGGPIVHVPTVVGAVAVTYNLPQITQPLRLTPDAIAGIFLGEITKWNDARIAATNPGAALPNEDVLVVHRTDGSGTTYVFTDYLTTVSPSWANGPGRSKQVAWPVGLGGKGNEGVAGQVKQTPGSIGYVETAYATQNRLPVAMVRNSAGNFVAPKIEAVTAAAAGITGTLSDTSDFRISIVNAPGEAAYPISSLTWILLYQHQPDSVKGRKLLDFLGWALTEGENSAAALDFAPLPAALVARVEERLKTVQLGTSAARSE